MAAFRAFLVAFLLLPAASCQNPTPSSAPSSEPALSVIAFGSCAHQDAPQPFWDAMLDHAPQLFLFTGDNVYADTDDSLQMRTAYEQLGEQPGFQRFARNVPILATWDDHDYGLNDGGADFPAREMAKREFMRFFSIPESSPLWERDGVYDVHYFGNSDERVQVILLDTRFFRGPLTRRPPGDYDTPGPYVPNPDTTVTMLGEAQWAWLEEQLREPAAVRIVVTSIQAIPEEHGWEKWANLPHERDRLFDVIDRTDAGGVLLISGDRHLAEISRLPADDPEGVGYPLYEITSSGLNRGGGGSPDEPNRYRVGPGNFRANNYGLLTIDWTRDDPLIQMQVFDDEGELGLEEEVALSTLGGTRDEG